MWRTSIIIANLCVLLVMGCRRTDVVATEAGAGTDTLNALSEASKRGDAPAVRRWLAAGADPNAADAKGVPPLHYAAASGQIAVVEALLSRGANVRACARDGSTALHSTAVDRDVRIAQLLISAGADINATTKDNVTPLMASLGSPYSAPQMALTLLRAGADPNILNSQGETALSIAVTSGSIELLEELLKRGANPNVRPTAVELSGNTPLHMAALNGLAIEVELLLHYGADPTIRNDEGKTPLDMLDIRNKNAAAIKELLAADSRKTP